MTPPPKSVLTSEELKEHLLANFCDGDSWMDARADRFTHEGALDIAKYFYELGLTAQRLAIVEEVKKALRAEATLTVDGEAKYWKERWHVSFQEGVKFAPEEFIQHILESFKSELANEKI